MRKFFGIVLVVALWSTAQAATHVALWGKCYIHDVQGIGGVTTLQVSGLVKLLDSEAPGTVAELWVYPDGGPHWFKVGSATPAFYQNLTPWGNREYTFQIEANDPGTLRPAFFGYDCVVRYCQYDADGVALELTASPVIWRTIELTDPDPPEENPFPVSPADKR